MTDDLNERTAKILGTWKDECGGSMDEHFSGWICDGCFAVFGSWGEDLKPHPKCRHYATDPATIPEMTKWLQSTCKGCERIAMTSMEDGHWMAGREYWYGDEFIMDVTEAGETLNLALARLVCAVAEANRP